MMTPLTSQEMFDTVARHLLTQGRRSLRGAGPSAVCAYRGWDGTKCAIGAIIPDDEYDPIMEGITVESMRVSTICRDTLPLAIRLQFVHDQIRPGDWPRALLKLAESFDLDPAVVVSFEAEENTGQ